MQASFTGETNGDVNNNILYKLVYKLHGDIINIFWIYLVFVHVTLLIIFLRTIKIIDNNREICSKVKRVYYLNKYSLNLWYQFISLVLFRQLTVECQNYKINCEKCSRIYWVYYLDNI